MLEHLRSALRDVRGAIEDRRFSRDEELKASLREADEELRRGETVPARELRAELGLEDRHSAATH